MADETPDLIAVARTGTGKGAARKSRREGNVPGVVYGGGQEPLPINVKFNVLLKKLKAGKFLSTLYNLKVEGHEDVRVICRNVQKDIIRDLPSHIDFMRLRQDSRINLFIPVEFINEAESPGIKRGGVLTVVRNEVELKCTASEIPDSIVVDMDGLDIGDVVTISSVKLPSGTRPMITDRDFVIANISAPSSLKASDDEDADKAEEGAAEGAAEEGAESKDEKKAD